MKALKKLLIWLVQGTVAYFQYGMLNDDSATESLGLGANLLRVGLIYLIPSISMVILLLINRAREDDSITAHAIWATTAFPAIVTLLLIWQLFAKEGFFIGLVSLLVLPLIYILPGAVVPSALLPLLGCSMPISSYIPVTSFGVSSDTETATSSDMSFEKNTTDLIGPVDRPIYLNDNLFGQGTQIGWVTASGIVVKDDWLGSGEEVGRICPGGLIEKGVGWLSEPTGNVNHDGYVTNMSGDYIGLVKPDGSVYRMVDGILGKIPDTNPVGQVNPLDYEAGAALILLLL